MALLSFGNAARAQKPAWLDGNVVECGHTSGNNGAQIPTCSVVLEDPGNSNPFARRETWIVTVQAYAGRTNADLHVGAHIKAYRTGETSQLYGFLEVQYLDKKGKEKQELHPILGTR